MAHHIASTAGRAGADRHRRLLAGLIAGLLCLPAGAAWACGGLFPETFSNDAASFAGQAVLIDRRADRVDVHVRLTVAPGAEAMAWVLPVPVGATLSLGDDAVFEALDAATAPQVTIHRNVSGGCSAGDSAGAPNDGVNVREVGQLGDYDYAIIGSADGAAAVAWLQTNGYAVPQTLAPALQPYAEDGLDFLGVRLSRGDQAADEGAPTPLVISSADVGDALPLFPLGLSALSTPERGLPVVIYVMGPGRATVLDARNVTIAELADDLAVRGSPGGLEDAFLAPRTDYQGLIDVWQARTEGPLWVTEAALTDWAGADALAPFERDGAMLTRLYARLPPEHIRDVRLGWDGRTAVSPTQTREVGDDESCRAAGGPSPGGWALLLGVVLFGLRRRRAAGALPQAGRQAKMRRE